MEEYVNLFQFILISKGMVTRTVGAIVLAVLMVLSPIGSVVAVSGLAGQTTVDAPDASGSPESHAATPGVQSRATFATYSAGASVGGSVDAPETAGAAGAEIGPGVAARIEQVRETAAPSRVPVLVVLREQPDDALDVRTLGGESARQRLIGFARDSQEPVIEYLRDQRRRGAANDIDSFWIRNVIAVEANPETIEGLAGVPAVERIIYDGGVHSLDGPSPQLRPLIERLEAHGNVSAGPQGFEPVTAGERVWSVEYTGADAVHERGITGEGVNVSVVDTGIDDDHPALRGQVLRWKDFVNASNTEPIDPNGHGTHVAGSVAGKRDAKFAVGTAPEANLFGARALSTSGGGNLSDVLAAFEWSANESADVISASLGADPLLDERAGNRSASPGTGSTVEFPVYADATDALGENATGIEGFKPSYMYATVVPVGEEGRNITMNATEQSRVMRNLSVALEDPAGDRPLRRISAGWMFETGDVPDSIGLWKFKPDASQPVMDGNWTLRVNSSHDANVTYEFQVFSAYPTNGSDELSRFVNNLAETQGVIPSIAAGNSGILGTRSLGSPGAAEEAITVGASGYRTNDPTFFSSRGPVGFGNDTRPGVDLIAPGERVVSAYPADLIPGADYDDAYVELSGTSTATPHVSGVAALLLSADPSLSRKEVTDTLTSTAQDLPHGENEVGAGALDAWAAVNSTVDLSDRDAESTEGIRHLIAGIGGTGDTDVEASIDPVSDPAGDAGNAPDISATSGSIVGGFEVVTHDTATPNATFTAYIDADRNDSTGDTANRGSEYAVVAERVLADGFYDLRTRAVEYDGSGYVSTTKLSVAPGPAGEEFIVVDDLRFTDRPASAPFEWHVVSSPTDGSDTDVAPDSGQVASPRRQSVTGLAVAWNATAGAPVTGEPVSFELYDRATGALVANETVETNATGQARADMTVAVLDSVPNNEFRLVIEDTAGNEIGQTYRVESRSILPPDAFSRDRIGDFLVKDRYYEARPNGTLSVNIPIYNDTGAGLIPYDGNASAGLGFGSDAVVRNDVRVHDGVLRLTYDFGNLSVDDGGGFVPINVALETDVRNATTFASGGSIEFTSGFVGTALGPPTTVASPGERTTLSFQNVGPDETPVNASVEHETVWITERQVAALFADLPHSTVEKVRTARRQADAGAEPTVTFTAADRAAIREARENLTEPQDVSVTATSGIADPIANGIGTFDTTPPSDARVGIVFAGVNASTVDAPETFPGLSLVFVEDRILQYARQQTEPQEESRYALDVEGTWETQRDGDYVVPSDTMRVEVALFDTENETLVGGATVRLYGSSGAVRTVTTNASRPVTVDVPAPDVDWVNSSFYERRQQVVGVAEGFRDAEGRALADDEFFNAFVDRIERDESGGTVAVPDLSYDAVNETVDVRVDYLNSSTSEPAEATRTLLTVGAPDASFGTERDVNVSFVDPASGATNATLAFDEPLPDDESRQYGADVLTGAMEFDHGASAFAPGASMSLDVPAEFVPGRSSTVTATVRDRTGDPLAGVPVVLLVGDSVDEPRSLPDGETLVNVTDANGTVTFDVAPPAGKMDTDADRGLLFLSGFATRNTSVPIGAEAFASIAEEPPVNVTGQVLEAGGDPAANDTVVAFTREDSSFPGPGLSTVDQALTDAAGNFSLTVPANATYDLAYFQGDVNDATDRIPRDGSPDVFGLAQVAVGSNDTAIASAFELPAAFDLNVSVVDESDNPVEGARVAYFHAAGASYEDSAVSALDASTNADGLADLSADASRDRPGLEMAGNVTVFAAPPEGEERFVEQAYRENVTVDADATVPITLAEADTTPPDLRNATAADADGDGNVTDGETVTIRAYANDSESAVEVFADASAFGAGEIELTRASGDLFTATFTADALNASTNGDYATPVIAIDAAGNTNETATNELRMEVSRDEDGTDVGVVTTSNATGAPGDEVTVEFNVTNTGGSERAYLLRLSDVPSNFSVTGVYNDTDGVWDGDSWLFQTIRPGESRQPNVTFSIPSTASGSYVVEAELLANDSIVDTARANVSTTVSIEEAIDADDSGRIGDFEILDAIALWRDGDEVSGTGGETIDDFDILDLIKLWRDGARVD